MSRSLLKSCPALARPHTCSHPASSALGRALVTSSEAQRPQHKDPPQVETFSSPSRPREYYARPNRARDLPPLQRKWPILLAFGVVGGGAWAAFYAYATNQEKLTSSVVRQIMDTLRMSPELREVLGSAIRTEPVWWLNGDPWISGSIKLPQGNVDLSFRVKGHKGAGTLYFTGIRKVKGEQFTILRFKVIADDGTVVDLPVTET